MKRYLKDHAGIYFPDALRGFLSICNVESLVALHGYQLTSHPDLFPLAAVWKLGNRYWKPAAYASAWNLEHSLWQAYVYKIGNKEVDIQILLPQDEIEQGKREIMESGGTGSGIWFSKLVVPQVERHLLGRSTVFRYGPMRWSKILDEAGQERH